MTWRSDYPVGITAQATRSGSNPLGQQPTRGLIPLTVVEIRRLFNLLTPTRQDTAHHLHWSWWRRRHQARARWYHYRARLT
jgi:hypothetical protein